MIHNMIHAGVIDAGMACGVEHMSKVWLGANVPRLGEGSEMTFVNGSSKPSDFALDMPDQFGAAERIADRRGITREEVDYLGLISQQKAIRATAEGRFEREIIPIEVTDAEGNKTFITRDGGLRETTAEKLATLMPVMPGGRHTAGNSSQISDGAAAVLWMDSDRAKGEGLKARAYCLAVPRRCGTLFPPRWSRTSHGEGAQRLRDDDERHRHRGDQRSLRQRGFELGSGSRSLP